MSDVSLSVSSRSPILECRNLSICRGDKLVLEDVSFSIYPGEILSIIGPNGGGKTTLIKALVGLLPPQQGEIIKHQELRVGYIPQDFSFNPLMPLTVRHFLEMSPYFSKSSLKKLAHDLSISDFFDVPFAGLSGGQMQRVLLVRALLCNPHLLILDEPDRSMDLDAQIHFYELLQKYRNSSSLVLISHDLHFVMASTDKVLCLNGHICCSGTPQEIGENAAYKQLFGSAIAKHFALYNHRHNHKHS